ncbi:hypothetical protein SAMN02745216_04109 [Desulfatibacillum alkenivorans DSM 16219]|uniref:Uncharacterized protein n=1 Tax=Desulfatibacillum alkenivorans DSM 16219 TaxID=1121393 RepID=A0A1M6VHK8_9BACT|nr:YdjY domain-containing protein [Desulfatibacillum alkenivorans]SHK80746.1 hypothetical protein SAMN02745216_04109 [Desulfatibacillum alkenivorans DSM 16219]
MQLSPKKWRHARLYFSILLALLLVNGIGLSSSETGADPAPEKTAKNFIQMGPLTINKMSKQATIKVRTAIDQGVLEYLMVDDHGKAYESAFKVDNLLPSKLNFSLLLLGIEPLDYNKLLELARNENGREALLAQHKNSLVRISLARGEKNLRLDEIVRDREKEKGELLWVFTGSRFTKDGRFVGDISLSHIAMWPDDSAVINLFSDRGNPYRGELGFVMNTENKALKKDQEFELVLEAYK